MPYNISFLLTTPGDVKSSEEEIVSMAWYQEWLKKSTDSLEV